VIGGGIAGAQAALDLATSGLKVFLIEKGPSLGGVMAQLDKTFPTNDCSMCILSPKLVELARHPNIEIITHGRLTGLHGEAGDFTATVSRRARYVDPDACTGCGLCAEKCPVKVPNEYDEGLGPRKAIYIPFAQAVPLVYTIDRESCRDCGICAKVCPAEAVRYDDQDEELQLRVGAVVLAPGFDKFDCSRIPQYAYDRCPDVVSSVEFERMLSANGPTGGHLKRMSDGAALKRIAFVQCVGSRDENHNLYCSAICCMASVKEAIIAREHDPSLEVEIFYMDMRAVRKDFERFFRRAQEKHGIVFTRCLVADIVPPITVSSGKDDGRGDDGRGDEGQEDEGKGIKLFYCTEQGPAEKEVDMVVLAAAMETPEEARELAATVGISLDRFGFCASPAMVPGATSKPGVFAAGAFRGPCDIPETVAQASAAAGMAGALLSSSRFSATDEKEDPPERDVTGEEPHIGVFVCHCGTNIGSVVDVPSVVEHASSLPGVIYAGENLFTCSEDTQHKIKEIILEKGLNRLVVAACSPRTHEPLFKSTMKEAGLNPSLFEMANIRDQCSWVHKEFPAEATRKSMVQVSMAVARAREMRPGETQRIFLEPSVLVLGGGITGMSSALAVAANGFRAYLVEKSGELGGTFRRLHSLENEDVRPPEFLDRLIREIESHPEIRIFREAGLGEIDGYVGNFRSRIEMKNGESHEITHGAVIVATGASELDKGSALEDFVGAPELKGDSPFTGGSPGNHDGIFTLLELEEALAKNDIAGPTAFIQCAGSRNDKRPYCSRVCCSSSLKNAVLLKKQQPEMPVYILYRDMRAYGLHELLYREAAKLDVTFIHYPDDEPPALIRCEDGSIEILVIDEGAGEKISITVNNLVLAAATIPPGDNSRLAEMLKVPLNQDGFFHEAHAKLRPVEFATDGIFLAGAAHSPWNAQECITQALAAASRTAALLSRGEMTVESTPAWVDKETCTGCGTCTIVCPYAAIIKDDDGKAVVITASCKSCGACASVCPENAIHMLGFSSREIMAEIEAALGGPLFHDTDACCCSEETTCREAGTDGEVVQ